MPDYRNRSNDPPQPGLQYEPTVADNVSWGLIAGALVLVLLAALAFSFGHGPTRTASNEAVPPAATRMAPPVPPATAPLPLNPAYPGLTPPAPQTNAQPQ